MNRIDTLRSLACFGCEYKEDCESSWEEGHQQCDDKMNDALDFVEETGLKIEN